MDKLEKSLNKLSAKEKAIIKSILLKLHTGEMQGMNMQKLQGHKDIFRIRKGNIRIIYQQKNEDTSILAIEKR